MEDSVAKGLARMVIQDAPNSDILEAVSDIISSEEYKLYKYQMVDKAIELGIVKNRSEFIQAEKTICTIRVFGKIPSSIMEAIDILFAEYQKEEIEPDVQEFKNRFILAVDAAKLSYGRGAVHSAINLYFDTKEYSGHHNEARAFLETCEKAVWIRANDLFEKYLEWAIKEEIDAPMNKHKFGSILKMSRRPSGFNRHLGVYWKKTNYVYYMIEKGNGKGLYYVDN